jgi:hypothetical protein
MEKAKFELNHTYLLHYGVGGTLFSATILMITDKAYYLRWNTGQNSSYEWKTKAELDSQYYVVEDISDFVASLPEAKNVSVTDTTIAFKYKYVPCYVCKGFGTVPESSSTAGTKVCPACNGSKLVIGSVES